MYVEEKESELNLEDGNNNIGPCEKCTYLGIQINTSGKTTKEIETRITKEGQIIGALNSVL